MARRHGRNGAIYLGVTSGAAASPVTFGAAWSVSVTRDVTDVTTLADTQHVYVAGLPDISGEFTGFWDDASSQAYIAAADALPRAFYLYPDAVNAPSVYFSGAVIADFSLDGSSGGPVSMKTTWAAASGQGYTTGTEAGLLDESGGAAVLDEAAGFILGEDGS